MSLKINDRATPKQIHMLKDLDYVGKWDLSTDEAAQLITELFQVRRDQLEEEKDNEAVDWF